jgi:hypothetical protein
MRLLGLQCNTDIWPEDFFVKDQEDLMTSNR